MCCSRDPTELRASERERERLAGAGRDVRSRRRRAASRGGPKPDPLFEDWRGKMNYLGRPERVFCVGFR